MEAKTTALAVAQPEAVVAMTMNTLAGFQALQRAAKCLTASCLVPDIYQGEKGLANAIIALEMANRMGANPLMVMQNLYVVYGRPGWSAQFQIATVNSCGRFSALRYETRPEGAAATDQKYECRAVATEKVTGEKLYGTWITWAMVKGEGWDSRKNKDGKCISKWPTMAEQMFRYRAAAFWTRSYAPEICMGLHTVEEIEDMGLQPNRQGPKQSAAQTVIEGMTFDEAPDLGGAEKAIADATAEEPGSYVPPADDLAEMAASIGRDK
jgi:hypothetical protein